MNPDNTSRLLLGLIEKLQKTPEEAEAILKSLTLRIVATSAVAKSAAAQAGLLTAINTGKRCFLGGVHVAGLEESIALKVPFAPFCTLNEAVAELLPAPLTNGPYTETIFVGESKAGDRDWVMHCGGWRGGVTVGRIPVPFYVNPATDFALGGVYAGGLAVHHAFFRAAQFDHRLERPQGISLWNLDDDWIADAGDGPPLDSLPPALWLIGLGHLGQAYLWALTLLPFPKPADCQLMLQDFDVLADANKGAALLAGSGDVGKLKTRVCRGWLDARGFTNTLICDRPFDTHTHRISEVDRKEPHIALCGLDNPVGRRYLENANFLRVLESGLGGSAADFDQIVAHSFPNQNVKAEQLWKNDVHKEANPTRLKILEKTVGKCGAVPLSTAAISSSFVGAVAASFVIAELLRMYHGGKQCWDGEISLRSSAAPTFKIESQPYDPMTIVRPGVLRLGQF
jgi:hypothetical protein